VSSVLVNLIRTATEINTKALFETASRLNNKTVLIELHARRSKHDLAFAIILSSSSTRSGTDRNARASSVAAANVFAVSPSAAANAERYCHEHRTTTYVGDPWLNPFHVLLRLLFSAGDDSSRPSSSKSRQGWTPTKPKDDKDGGGVCVLDKHMLDLLGRFANFVEPAVVLDLVPSSTCLADLLPFLRVAVPAATHRRHELHLETGLHRSYNLQIRWEQAKLSAESFVLGMPDTNLSSSSGERSMREGGGGDLCGVCNKPMAGRVFARVGVAPATPVHLHCAQK
jgi:hypothetical protein